MSTYRKFGIFSAVAILMAIALSPSAHAVVVELDGGDPGEGYAPLNSTVYAYHFVSVNGAATDTIQEVPFLPYNVFAQTNPNVSLVSGAPYPSNGPEFDSSPDDLALEDMGDVIIYGQNSLNPPYMTLNLNGLVEGNTYQLDLFWFYHSGVVPLTYEITANNVTVIEEVDGVGGIYYNIRTAVVAGPTSSTQIRVVAKKVPGGQDGPYINGFSVTEFVPEPTSAALLCIGSAVLSLRRGRRMV